MTGTSAFMDALKLYLDPAVFGTLGLMSVLMFGFVAERMFYLSRVNVSRFDDIYSLEIDLTRHLTAIASIGANAPYVGLLGTVFGILLTFYD
ncbi:MAG: MotA/TolQ/ExbB proton channel family protein, partial [Gammaproteobacteria bacterium]